ncbi:MAG: GNAT family N-acetyltransferase [Defluviitaleaceae bacterium]|nr:GNAT family N-acetyltransferase [Defluviitaleaceae bacterium]
MKKSLKKKLFEYKIIKFGKKTATPQNMRYFCILESNMAEKYGLVERYRNTDEQKEFFALFIDNADSNDELFIIVKGGALPCGFLICKDVADWGGNIRRQLTINLSERKMNEKLLEIVDAFIKAKLTKYDTLAIIAKDKELGEIIRSNGGKRQYAAQHYTLARQDIDAKTLAELAAKREKLNGEMRMAYYDAIPEELYEQYSNLFSELQEDMPDVNEPAFVQYVETPEKMAKAAESFAKNNRTHHCYAVFNENDEMIAMSNVSVYNNDPRYPYQFLIGVKKQYRGFGIGKWLYAMMYQKLIEVVDFEKVEIDHHPNNAHAINISEWIGYKYAHTHTTYLIAK